jgi:hypothetical protein
MGKKIDWILAIIIVSAFLIRMLQFENGVQWSNLDTARDMLVAKHINLYGEYPTRGPAAAGGYGFLLNSTFYYYFWAAILKFIPFEMVIPMVMMCFGIGIIILCNLIGGLTVGRFSKYLWLVVAVFSPELIKMSVDPSQPGMVVFFILLVLFGLTKFYKTGNSLWLLCAILGNWLGLEIHYSIFSLYPLFIFLFLVSHNKWKGIQGKFKFKRELLLAGLASGFVWAMRTYINSPGDQIYYFSEFLNRSDFDLKSVFESMVHLVKLLLIDLTGVEIQQVWLVGILGIIIIFLGLIKLVKKGDKWALSWFGGLSVGILLISTQLRIVPSAIEYIRSYFILFPFLLIYFMEKILSPKLMKVVVLIFSLMIVYFSYKLSNFKYFSQTDNITVKHMADIILNDALINFKDKNLSFNIWHDNNGGQLYDYSAAMLWLKLENITGRQLVKLDINSGNVFYQNDNNVDYGYLVCSSFGGFVDIGGCQEDFLKNYLGKYKLSFIEKSSDEEITKWLIYRVNSK